MVDVLEAPRRLERRDGRSGFDSGAEELDDWFARFAWENQRANNSVTYVAMVNDQVVGYYAIAASGVSHADAGEEFSRRRPDPIPCVLLARLAVDRRAQGRGVGVALFRDALERALSVSQGMGAACLLIHCRDDSARAFYLRHVDAIQSPLDELQLVVPMKAIASQLPN